MQHAPCTQPSWLLQQCLRTQAKARPAGRERSAIEGVCVTWDAGALYYVRVTDASWQCLAAGLTRPGAVKVAPLPAPVPAGCCLLACGSAAWPCSGCDAGSSAGYGSSLSALRCMHDCLLATCQASVWSMPFTGDGAALQVSWDMKQQLKLLHAPGAGLAPVTVADPIVDARVALWLLYPNSGSFTDSEELTSSADRVQAPSCQGSAWLCKGSAWRLLFPQRHVHSNWSTYDGMGAVSWACSLCVCNAGCVACKANGPNDSEGVTLCAGSHPCMQSLWSGARTKSDVMMEPLPASPASLTAAAAKLVTGQEHTCFIEITFPQASRHRTTSSSGPALWTLITQLTWAGLAQDAASIGTISVKLLGDGPANDLVKRLTPGFQNLYGPRITTCRLCPLALALWAKAAPSLQASPAWTRRLPNSKTETSKDEKRDIT